MTKLIVLFLLLAGMSFGQTTVAPFLSSKIQLLDNSGVVCSGCLLDTFAAGTTTPLATYSESTGTSLNANPVVLDSAGRATVYLTSASYKFRLRSALGVTLWTQDVISWNTPLSTFAGLIDTGDLTLQQSTAATNVANQSSNNLKVQGTYWTGAASANDIWNLQDVLGTGTNPTSTLTLTHSGSSGSANFSVPGNLTRKISGRTCYADQYNGADAGAKMIAAEADSSCSIVDATGFTGAQSGTSTVTATVPLILGAYTYTSSANPAISVGTQSALSGQGMLATIVASSSNTADVVKIPSASVRWSVHDLQITQPSTRSAGVALRVSGGNGTITNIYIPLFFDGMFFDTAVTAGLNMVTNFYFGNATDTGTPHCAIRNGGVSSGTVSSNQFSNGAILENANYSDAMICIQDGSDTILFSNVHAVWDVVHAGTVAFHSELVNAGIEPYDIKAVNCVFEAGGSANVMVFDSIRAFECTNCSASGGLDGVRLNGGVTTGGGGEWQWIGGKISNNHAHGLDIESGGIGDITVIGTRFADNGQNTNNTFDDIFNVGAGNVQLIGNEFNKINSSAPPNNVKWNIEIAAGNCGNYTIVGNNYAQAGVSGTISNGCTAPKGISLDANSGTANIVSPSGMTFKGATSGGANIAAPSVAGTPSLVLPTVSGTFSLATAQDCGTTTTCSHTDISSTLKIVKGSAPLVSGTPSTATVTGFSPAFTSSSSFVCTATNATTQANSIKVVNASASSITLTGPNTVTDTVNYSCTGT